MSDILASQQNDTSSVEERAYYWMCRLRDSDCSEAEQNEFLDWCKTPANFEAFQQAKRVRSDLSALANRPAITALRQRILQQGMGAFDADDELAEDGLESAAELQNDGVELVSSAPSSNIHADAKSPQPQTAKIHSLEASRRKRVPTWTKFSAGFAVAAALALFAVLPYFKNIHQTAVGEIRTLVLNDGSTVTLDTDTKIRVAFNDQQRTVVLSRGQAFFAVAKNPLRPFVVDTGSDTVTAVGTAFAVRKSGSDFTVLLSEGIVDIGVDAGVKQKAEADKVVRLHAGEKWQASPGKIGDKTELDDMDTRLGWMKGTLVFRSSPLKDVIAEVNRYSEKSVSLNDTSLKESKIDAVFHVGKTESFLIALKRMLDLELDYDADGNITLSKTKKQG